jgi:hypothetical protein
VVDGNVCHDVRAYMSGGYCLSQDQGSSNIHFQNNVCLRTTASPQNTHYGVNITYSNNVFYGGNWDSWVQEAPGSLAAGALRTSPNMGASCGSVDFPTTCPDQLRFEQNLIGLWSNSSASLFDGNFNDSSATVPGQLNFSFDRNFYWSENADVHLPTAAVFGGESSRYGRGRKASRLTWDDWQSQHGHTQDQGSMLGAAAPFLDAEWRTTLNVTVDPQSALVLRLGWQQVDTTSAGPR